MFLFWVHVTLLVLNLSGFVHGEMPIQINAFQDNEFIINLNATYSRWSIVYIKGSHATISKICCTSFSEN